MSDERKAYIWSGVLRSDLKVEVGPIAGKPGELVNLSIQREKTYRDDIDGVHWSVYCDSEFDLRISHKSKLIMLLHSQEVRKYWKSTIEEALESARLLLCKNCPELYIYKKAENFYEFYMSEMKFAKCQLVETVRWQPKAEAVANEIID